MRFNQISLPYPLPAAIHTQYARLTLLVLVLIGVALLRDQLPWLTEVPAVLILPITDWVRSALDWLITSLDFGPFTFKDVTRALAWLLYQPIDFAEVVLVAGRQNFAIGAVPWVAVVGGVAILGHYLGGRRLALIAGGCFLYLALFGQWQSAMQTFTILIVAVPIAVLLGLGLGVLAARVRRVEMALLPILDVMQSLPHYAYLVPIVFSLRVRSRPGYHRHHHIRHPADGSVHDSGHQVGAKRRHRRRLDVGMLAEAIIVEGANSRGAADVDARCQPGHLANAGHGGDRLSYWRLGTRP